MKKIISIILCVVLVVSMPLNLFAFENYDNFETLDKVYNDISTLNITKADILALEKYISVNKKGFFEINKKQAKADGIDDFLLNGQENYLNHINSLIKTGELKANENLEIKSNIKRSNVSALSSGHWWSWGGGLNTDVSYHWWGYSRYACDCETQRMSADFNTCASVGAGIAVVAAYFGAIPAIPPGLSSAYWWLLASRLDANNHGRGVYIEMTWVLVFDITPQ